MQNNRSRGFTLIELLVVIAIIGILSAVVLASLNTARSKGNDAAIKSNLDTIRTQSGIYYDTNTAYATIAVTAGTTATSGLCNVGTVVAGAGTTLFADPNVTGALVAADKAAGTAAAVGLSTLAKDVCSYTTNMAAWLVAAPLTAVSGTYWCVDSTGASRQISAAPGAAVTACPAS